MREKENNWQRIEAVIKWANMSTNYFARYIGLARGENLYQIKRGNNGISFDVANRVVAKFPQIDKLWLLTGEGQMFAAPRERGAQVPFYDVDVEQGLPQLERLHSDEWLCFAFSRAVECDFAMVYKGRAMGDSIPPGSIVLLKAVDRESIIPGEEYAIVSRKIVTLRIVRSSGEEGKLRLTAANRADYDDIVVNISDIDAVYKVKGKLIINS